MIPLKEMYKETNIIRFYRNEKLFALPTLTSVWNFDRDKLENNHFISINLIFKFMKN